MNTQTLLTDLTSEQEEVVSGGLRFPTGAGLWPTSGPGLWPTSGAGLWPKSGPGLWPPFPRLRW